MRVERVEVVDSTNAVARRWLRAGRLVEPTGIVAREQTAGRGTRGRGWVSPRDAGLYVSLVYCGERVALPVTAAYTRAAGVGCVEALASCGVEAGLRGVNDIVAGGGKLGGILTELVVEAGEGRALIVGIGINVRVVVREIGSDAALPAVSIEEVLGAARIAEFDSEGLLREVMGRCGGWIERVMTGGEAAVELAWAERTTPTGAGPEADLRVP